MVILAYVVAVLVFVVLISVALFLEIWADRDKKFWKKLVFYVAIFPFVICAPVISLFIGGLIHPDPPRQDNIITQWQDHQEDVEQDEKEARENQKEAAKEEDEG